MFLKQHSLLLNCTAESWSVGVTTDYAPANRSIEDIFAESRGQMMLIQEESDYGGAWTPGWHRGRRI